MAATEVEAGEGGGPVVRLTAPDEEEEVIIVTTIVIISTIAIIIISTITISNRKSICIISEYARGVYLDSCIVFSESTLLCFDNKCLDDYPTSLVSCSGFCI